MNEHMMLKIESLEASINTSKYDMENHNASGT